MAYLGNINLSDGYIGNSVLDAGTTTVTPGVYGSGDGLQIPVITVNSKGQITNATNVSTSIANTTVTPGVYGSGDGLQISVITVNSQGRITSASNVDTPVISVAGATGAVSNNQIADGFTSAIPPGTSGNVLTSTGTTWESAAPEAGGGSGLFNTNISTAVGYLTTTSMAAAFTAPADAGKRYIVHSIHVTHINEDYASEYGQTTSVITGEFTGTTYPTGIAFCDTVPVPQGSSVELLKKPKVLQPSDAIRLQASTPDTLHVTITIEVLVDTTYFGQGIDLTTGDITDLYTATANSVIESVLLSNDDAGSLDVKVDVVWTNAANTIQGYLSYDLIVPNDATVELLEQPKFIPNGFKVRVQANQANRLETIIAGKTI